jgi:methionyl aminopeptidase
MKIGRNDLCPCKSGKKYKRCCINSPYSPWNRSNQETKPKVFRPKFRVKIRNKREISLMREAGKLAAKVLNALEPLAKPGTSTQELNDVAHQITLDHGALSAPLGYLIEGAPPFPRSICTSVNDVVCHGIPHKDVLLKDGDIINCDITVKLKGYHGDTSRTFLVGDVSPGAKKLVEVTQQAMMIGIQAIKPGGCISDIGGAIEDFVAPHKYGIVEALTGHGIGDRFHEDPAICHFAQNKFVYPIKPGMIFTVEPMLNIGNHEVQVLPDRWTMVTKDGSLSAQFEHTCLVTVDGVEILTLEEAHEKPAT